MPFCRNCGAEYALDSKFCGNCGTNLVQVNEEINNKNMHEEKVLWQGKPNGLTDRVKEKANINTTEYIITNERIIIKTGMVKKKQDEIELIRVKEIKVTQSLKEKLLKIGNIEIISTDVSTPTIMLDQINEPEMVKEIIRRAVREEKASQGISYQERI